jgi:hypothetical protein
MVRSANFIRPSYNQPRRSCRGEAKRAALDSTAGSACAVRRPMAKHGPTHPGNRVTAAYIYPARYTGTSTIDATGEANHATELRLLTDPITVNRGRLTRTTCTINGRSSTGHCIPTSTSDSSPGAQCALRVFIGATAVQRVVLRARERRPVSTASGRGQRRSRRRDHVAGLLDAAHTPIPSAGTHLAGGHSIQSGVSPARQGNNNQIKTGRIHPIRDGRRGSSLPAAIGDPIKI